MSQELLVYLLVGGATTVLFLRFVPLSFFGRSRVPRAMLLQRRLRNLSCASCSQCAITCQRRLADDDTASEKKDRMPS